MNRIGKRIDRYWSRELKIKRIQGQLYSPKKSFEIHLATSNLSKKSKITHSEYVANSEQTISRLTEENAKLRADVKMSRDYADFDETKIIDKLAPYFSDGG